jgi:hypothetical protein
MAQIIDLTLVRTLRNAETVNRNLEIAANCLRESTDYVKCATDEFLDTLHQFSDHLGTIAQHTTVTLDFCAECLEAFELTDLAAMEAARDRLRANFELRPRFTPSDERIGDQVGEHDGRGIEMRPLP